MAELPRLCGGLAWLCIAGETQGCWLGGSQLLLGPGVIPAPLEQRDGLGQPNKQTTREGVKHKLVKETTMRRITWIAAAAAVASMVPGAAAAAVEPIKINFAIGRPENFDDVPHKRGVSKQDRKYMAETWNLHLFEVMAGELAMDNGRSVWTRQFGEDMVREHSLALIELKQLARNKGVNLPDYLSGKYANMLAKLERLDGNDFDRAYRQMMVSGHGNAERLMAREVKFGRDEFVRGYATKMLASTDTHQKLAMHHQVVVLDRSATRGTAAQPMRP